MLIHVHVNVCILNLSYNTELNDLLIGDFAHPAIKRKSQIIQLHMHVHVASSPALQTHDENSLLLFLELFFIYTNLLHVCR